MTRSPFDSLTRLAREPLFDQALTSQRPDPINRAGIKRLIPHRDPFLFLDSIELIAPETPGIICRRWIDPDDPILAGHFPGNPIFPGALQGEMIFQACLALLWFLTNETTEIPRDAEPLEAVATSVDRMTLLAPVHPGDTVTIQAGLSDYDSMLATGVGQILVGNRICTFGTGNFHVT